MQSKYFFGLQNNADSLTLLSYFVARILAYGWLSLFSYDLFLTEDIKYVIKKIW